MSPFPKLFCGAALLMALAVGCSSEPKRVYGKGKLVVGTQPLGTLLKVRFPKQRWGVNVTFVPMDKGDKPNPKEYPCDFKPEDSTFEAGYQGKGLPVGKYRIAVALDVPGGITNAPPDMRAFFEKFTTEHSPIIRELKDEEPMIIDLNKPEG